jgi:L-cysteine desulfidase
VLKNSTGDHLTAAKLMLENGQVHIVLKSPCEDILYARARLSAGERWCSVTIVGEHTRIVSIETQDGILFSLAENGSETLRPNPLESLASATLAEIVDFAVQVPFEAIRFILDAGQMNDALSRLGLQSEWGLHIGRTLEKQRHRGLLADDISTAILIRTSAASDARMGGASLPAMTNSGSGNQGITATLPVLIVAEHFAADDEKLARALMLSHLSAIYIHNQLPRLSALCATTTAAMGAAAGMALLAGGDYAVISMAIASMIGDVSGMICDGASNSCAMKVSTSVSSAWKAVLLALDGSAVSGNDGIVGCDVEHSIANLCALARHAMQHTDQQIIEIMSHKATV